MANKSEETQTQTSPAAKAHLPLIPLVLAVLVAVVAAVGLCAGAAFWLVHSGHIPLTTGVKPVAAASIPAPSPTHLVALDPLLVNLADEDGHAYLRVSVTLRVEDKPLAKGEKAKEETPAKGKAPNEFEAAERDAALSVLGRQTSAGLLASSGKEQLKQELKAVFTKRVPEVKVQEVLLTEFLVQH